MTATDEKKPPRKRQRCGTVAGYKMHVRHHEITCDACKAANAAEARRRRAKNKGRDVKRKESRQDRQDRLEEEGGEIVAAVERETPAGAPTFLKRAGRELWEEITAAYDLDASARVVLLEVCRMRDRLERFAAALSSQSTLWFELGEPQETMDGDVQMQVVVSGMISEARQMQAAIRHSLNGIGVLKQAERKQEGESMMDQLKAKREERLAQAKKGVAR